MRKFTTTILLVFPLAIFGQVKFSNATFEEVVKESQKTSKIIFLQFESNECERCNEVADKGFQDPELSKLLQESFVCFKVSPSHPDRELIRSLYNINEFGSYFIDQQKTLLHSYQKTSTRAADYREQVEIVFNRAGEELRLSELEKQYNSGEKTLGMLRLILEKRKSLALQTDSLLGEYVSMVPADSSASIEKLVFVAQMAPILDSRADKFLRRDNAVFNKAWYTIVLSNRIAINNQIIYKSKLKAIREKDEAFAYRVATFARLTHNDRNSEPARKTFASNLLNFYKEVKDTAKYLLLVVNYYDNFYMTISNDSIRMRDTILMKEAMSKAQTVTVRSGDTTRTKKAFSYAPIGQRYSSQLIEGAENLYSMTSDPVLIQKALQWAIKANSFYETSQSLSVWAKILYNTGNKEEAINRQKQSIALRQKQGFPTKAAEEMLAKMTSGAKI